MSETSIPATLPRRIEEIIQADDGRDAKLLAICTLLRDDVAHYDWVGFYITKPGTRELHLGPYVGDPTDHAVIPFGRGICGQAAEREETFVVPDVRDQSNYLSCSVNVRSEIVVPVMLDGRVVAELDIDSHAVDPFTDVDTKLCESICALVAGLFTDPG